MAGGCGSGPSGQVSERSARRTFCQASPPSGVCLPSRPRPALGHPRPVLPPLEVCQRTEGLPGRAVAQETRLNFAGAGAVVQLTPPPWESATSTPAPVTGDQKRSQV